MNLLDIIERDGLKLKKVGTEYQGPCPFCQAGTDRFHVHPNNGDHGSYWCRVCGKKGDAIQFLRDYKGMGYREACECIGKEVKEIQRKSKGPKTPTAPEVKTELAEMPRECKEPEEMWRERAEALVEWGHRNITSGQWSVVSGQLTPMQWLVARGISIETIGRFRLGWNPGEGGKDIYRSRSSWGLPEEKNSQGRPKKIWIPRGLIIPCLVDGHISRVRIRRPDVKEGEDRFILIPGGYTGPMVVPKSYPHPNPLPEGEGETKAWVIVESELDAILIAQEVGDIVGVMAMGNNIARPDGPAMKLLKESLCILNAMDYDEGGAVPLEWWQKQFEQCERWPVPKAKDPGDYYKEGGNIREWVMAGLPPVFKISPHPHLNPPLEREEIKTSPRLQGEGQGEGGVKHHVIEAADGRRVYITDDILEYKRLQRERKIVFNSKELALVRPESAEKVMDAKEIWKKAEIVEPMDTPDVGAGLAPALVQTGQPQGIAPTKTGPEMTQGGLF